MQTKAERRRSRPGAGLQTTVRRRTDPFTEPTLRQAARALFCLASALVAGLIWPMVKGGADVAVQGGAVRNSLGMAMVAIPAGQFTMGADEGLWDRRPAHPVRLASPFHISATEVTAEQYRQFRPHAELREVDGFACGISWHDAVAFCEWLGKREGKPYRLPTEAEWEYACRSADRWGVRGMASGPLEWCADWYGEYAPGLQADPVGPEHGVVRVVRGGTLDHLDPSYRFVPATEYSRPWHRAGMPPSFGPPPGGRPSAAVSGRAGLTGVWYGSSNFERPQTRDPLMELQRDWSGDGIRGGDWSAEWHGLLTAPASGETVIEAETGGRLFLSVDGATVIDGLGKAGVRRGTVALEEGRRHRVVLRYSNSAVPAELRLFWTLPGSARAPIPAGAVSHDAQDVQAVAALLPGGADDGPGRHTIGFRVVQAPAPATRPTAPSASLAQQGVRTPGAWARQGPDPARPHFRRRPALPTPLETDARPEYQAAIDAVGLHPSFRGHNHSPALAVCDNGDVLAVYYTSYKEYEPEVSLIAARLRFGSDEWDMPSPFIDLPSANDHAPLLWSDGGAMHLFWGSPKFGAGAFPFQWTTSKDCGATWGEVRFPAFDGEIGPHSRQPINSAFRGADGSMFLSSDAAGSTSVLWTSPNDGDTWRDTGGRTAGRHTAFCLLGEGRILGMGGKNSDIDGYMPRAISADNGATWQVDRSPFCAQGGNQRPSLLRLASGRLFFAADLQRTGGVRPAGADMAGSYVALSSDDGQTWRIKRLPGALPHEAGPSFFGGLPGATTLGYSVARQAPNGVIHLLTTMNRPCMHFEMNEAWILSDDPAPAEEAGLRPAAMGVRGVQVHEERRPDGRVRLQWRLGVGDDGRPLMHGREVWFYPDGRKQYEATWNLGRKVGLETYWRPDGRREWQWRRAGDGTSVWTQWWENGRRKAESSWRGDRAEGPARLYDRRGRLQSERQIP
jgi:hypothetical protein